MAVGEEDEGAGFAEESPYPKEVSKADAISYFTEKGDQYKLELISELEDGKITFYEQGNFTDLCRGPHIPDTEFHQGHQADQYCRGLLEGK